MTCIVESIKYVMSASYFWQAMSATVMTSMFLGAIIYQDHHNLRHDTVLLLSYLFFLLITSVLRVFPRIQDGTAHYGTYSSTVSLLVVSFFYFLGLGLGYLITKKAGNHLHFR